MSERIKRARLAASLTDEERAARTARQTGPLTQAELAHRMGVERVVVTKIENGGSVGPRTAERLARALGGSAADWIEPRETRARILSEISELRERVATLERLLREQSGAGESPPTRRGAT